MVQYSQLHYGHDKVIWEDSYSSRHTHNSYGSGSETSRQNNLAGRIMWLPPKPLNATFNFEDGCHNHPVLMLSSHPKDGMVDFFIMTSLKQTSLEQRYPGPHNITIRSHYLPIAPADRHPDNGILLDVSSPGGQMRKKTYVYTEKVRTAPLSALEDLTNRKTNQPMRLSDRSLAAVKIHARYTPPTTRVSQFVTIAHDESETTPLLPRHRCAGAPEQPRKSIFLLIASSVGSFLCYIAVSFIAVLEASRAIGLNLFQLLLLGGLIFGIIYGAYLLVVAIVGAVVGAVVGAWQWTAQEVTYVGAAIGGFFVEIGHWFGGAWEAVVTALVSAWQWIVQGIEGLGVALEEFFRSLEG